MIRISGFNTNSIQLNEIKSAFQESIDLTLTFNVTKKFAGILGIVLYCNNFWTTQRRWIEHQIQSVLGASGINVGDDYKPDETAIVAFGKTVKRVI